MRLRQILVFPLLLAALCALGQDPPKAGSPSSSSAPPAAPAAPHAGVASLAEIPYKPAFDGDPARSRSEASALGYIRTLIDAQRNFKKKYNKYSTSLRMLVGSGSFTKRMVNTDRGEYQVAFHNGLSVSLTPRLFDARRRAFFSDDAGNIHVDETQPASAASPYLHPD